MKDKQSRRNFSQEHSSRFERSAKKQPPPVKTFAETYYYKKQIGSRTEMVIVLQDGEEVHGTIEWYDSEALKINRKDSPNILLLRHNIKYMFKASEL